MIDLFNYSIKEALELNHLATFFLLSTVIIVISIVKLFHLLNIKHWYSVQGELVTSDQGPDGTLLYKYVVDGKNYIGNNLSPVKKLDINTIDKIKIKNGKVKVYYHPEKPQASYLMHDSSGRISKNICLIAFLIFINITCGFLLLLARSN